MASSATEMAIFQRVAERGSFASAAEDVGLSPSAVAKLITRLETRLGVRLIKGYDHPLPIFVVARSDLRQSHSQERKSGRPVDAVADEARASSQPQDSDGVLP